mgnify:CR=1 FL=1
MLNQEIQLSELIIQNFGQDTLDLVSEACEFLADFNIKYADSETARWSLWFFNNYKTLNKVSFFVDESHDKFEVEYNFNFDGIDPLDMMDSKFYCIDEKKSYEVTETIKMLCEIGQGISWAISIEGESGKEREINISRKIKSLTSENESLKSALWGSVAK